MQGWECPKCGRVFAPWVATCRACAATPAPLPPPLIPGPIRPTFPRYGTGDFPEFEPRITCVDGDSVLLPTAPGRIDDYPPPSWEG